MREQSRLRRSPDVLRVRYAGRTQADRMFSVALAPGLTAHSRLAVVATARLGGAVVRNRARRRTRAVFEPLLTRLREPVDLLVTVRAAAVGAAFPELGRAAASLLRAHGLLEATP